MKKQFGNNYGLAQQLWEEKNWSVREQLLGDELKQKDGDKFDELLYKNWNELSDNITDLMVKKYNSYLVTIEEFISKNKSNLIGKKVDIGSSNGEDKDNVFEITGLKSKVIEFDNELSGYLGIEFSGYETNYIHETSLQEFLNGDDIGAFIYSSYKGGNVQLLMKWNTKQNKMKEEKVWHRIDNFISDNSENALVGKEIQYGDISSVVKKVTKANFVYFENGDTYPIDDLVMMDAIVFEPEIDEKITFEKDEDYNPSNEKYSNESLFTRIDHLIRKRYPFDEYEAAPGGVRVHDAIAFMPIEDDITIFLIEGPKIGINWSWGGLDMLKDGLDPFKNKIDIELSREVKWPDEKIENILNSIVEVVIKKQKEQIKDMVIEDVKIVINEELPKLKKEEYWGTEEQIERENFILKRLLDAGFNYEEDEAFSEYALKATTEERYNYILTKVIPVLKGEEVVEKLNKEQQIEWLKNYVDRWDLSSHIDIENDKLVKEYQNWILIQGLPSMSADELIMELQKEENIEEEIIEEEIVKEEIVEEKPTENKMDQFTNMYYVVKNKKKILSGHQYKEDAVDEYADRKEVGENLIEVISRRDIDKLGLDLSDNSIWETDFHDWNIIEEAVNFGVTEGEYDSSSAQMYIDGFKSNGKYSHVIKARLIYFLSHAQKHLKQAFLNSQIDKAVNFIEKCTSSEMELMRMLKAE